MTEVSQTRWPQWRHGIQKDTRSITRGKASALLVPLPPSTRISILIITSHHIHLKTATQCGNPEFQQQISPSPPPVPKQMGSASKQRARHCGARMQRNNAWMPTQGPSPKTSPFLLATHHIGMCPNHFAHVFRLWLPLRQTLTPG